MSNPNDGTTVSVGDLLHENAQMKEVLRLFARHLNSNWKNARATQEVQIKVPVGELRLAAYYAGDE